MLGCFRPVVHNTCIGFFLHWLLQEVKKARVDVTASKSDRLKQSGSSDRTKGSRQGGGKGSGKLAVRKDSEDEDDDDDDDRKMTVRVKESAKRVQEKATTKSSKAHSKMTKSETDDGKDDVKSDKIKAEQSKHSKVSVVKSQLAVQI